MPNPSNPSPIAQTKGGPVPPRDAAGKPATPAPVKAPEKPAPPATPANKPAAHAAVKPAEGTPAEKAHNKAEDKPAFDWDAMPPAKVDEGIARGDTIDVMKEVPAIIRKDVEESLDKFFAAVKAAKEGARVSPVWLVKDLPNVEAAKEFTRLAKRYAKYRPDGQITVRGGPLKKKPATVRFSAKPFEKRDTAGKNEVKK